MPDPDAETTDLGLLALGGFDINVETAVEFIRNRHRTGV